MARKPITERMRRQGQRLRALREQVGVSKPAIAERMGFDSSQTIELYERGATHIWLDEVVQWAAAFEVDPQAFVSFVLHDDLARPSDWSFREELQSIVPADILAPLIAYWEQEPLIDQRAAAVAIKQMAEKMRSTAWKPSRETSAS